jgi:hypothetical protein
MARSGLLDPRFRQIRSCVLVGIGKLVVSNRLLAKAAFPVCGCTVEVVNDC